jgi:pepF/M3 family oligoendopeptidase
MTAIDDATRAELPRWSLDDLFPSVTDRAFTDQVELLDAELTRAAVVFDHHDVREVERREPTADDGRAADEVIAHLNVLMERIELLSTYAEAFVTTDSRDATAQRVSSRLDTLAARLPPLVARLAQWVAALDPEALGDVSTQAADHAGPLLRLAARAEHQMPELQEDLYAELRTTGSNAWGRLHSDVTSQLTATVEVDGRVETSPMAAVRGMASSANPVERRAAYEAEMVAWPTVAVPCAAAMNAIKGEAVAVNRRRDWKHPLDASLFANSVGRATFDAMQTAVVASLPDFRRWMRAKARLHGHDGALPWWDLFAPLPTAGGAVAWTDGVALVDDAFSGYSPHLADVLHRAVGERWIDAEPRDGKVDGAFCAGITGDRSIVLMNWRGSSDSVQTLAHELGHAYHNVQLAQRTKLQQQVPMALAETASIFCETLMVERGLAAAQGTERLALLDTNLRGANQVVVDIHSRFLFESSVFERRANGTLSPKELCDLMGDAQQRAYGDGLDQATAHHYMWAVKPHYYGPHFYNWPYTYGLLFGLGLYARFRDDPERFRAGYDDLLSRCGMATAEELGEDFALDVERDTFWTASLDVLRDRIDEYERLADELSPTASS